jgi:hypothetical protein
MFRQFRLVAAPLIAGGIIALTATSGWAFSQQTVQPNGNYNFNYGDPDDKAKLNESTTKPDPNSPGFHFSIQSGQTSPYGFHSFGGSGNDTPPDYYARPLGNGN